MDINMLKTAIYTLDTHIVNENIYTIDYNSMELHELLTISISTIELTDETCDMYICLINMCTQVIKCYVDDNNDAAANDIEINMLNKCVTYHKNNVIKYDTSPFVTYCINNILYISDDNKQIIYDLFMDTLQHTAGENTHIFTRVLYDITCVYQDFLSYVNNFGDTIYEYIEIVKNYITSTSMCVSGDISTIDDYTCCIKLLSNVSGDYLLEIIDKLLEDICEDIMKPSDVNIRRIYIINAYICMLEEHNEMVEKFVKILHQIYTTVGIENIGDMHFICIDIYIQTLRKFSGDIQICEYCNYFMDTDDEHIVHLQHKALINNIKEISQIDDYISIYEHVFNLLVCCESYGYIFDLVANTYTYTEIFNFIEQSLDDDILQHFNLAQILALLTFDVTFDGDHIEYMLTRVFEEISEINDTQTSDISLVYECIYNPHNFQMLSTILCSYVTYMNADTIIQYITYADISVKIQYINIDVILNDIIKILEKEEYNIDFSNMLSETGFLNILLESNCEAYYWIHILYHISKHIDLSIFMDVITSFDNATLLKHYGILYKMLDMFSPEFSNHLVSIFRMETHMHVTNEYVNIPLYCASVDTLKQLIHVSVESISKNTPNSIKILFSNIFVGQDTPMPITSYITDTTNFNVSNKNNFKLCMGQLFSNIAVDITNMLSIYNGNDMFIDYVIKFKAQHTNMNIPEDIAHIPEYGELYTRYVSIVNIQFTHTHIGDIFNEYFESSNASIGQGVSRCYDVPVMYTPNSVLDNICGTKIFFKNIYDLCKHEARTWYGPHNIKDMLCELNKCEEVSEINIERIKILDAYYIKPTIDVCNVEKVKLSLQDHIDIINDKLSIDVGDQMSASMLASESITWIIHCMCNHYDIYDIYVGLTKLIASAYFINYTSVSIEEHSMNMEFNAYQHIIKR